MYKKLLDEQKSFFESGITRDYAFRLQQLKKLEKTIKENESKIIESLYLDLGKSKEESILTEISVVLNDLNYTIKKLKQWMKVKRVKTPLVLFPGKSRIISEPYGTVLIISPWNYPFQLTINPLIGAIAAGNTVIIKPSPLSVNTSNVIKEIISSTFKDSYISCVLGDIDVGNELLKLKTNYIFFTGSTQAGKNIMRVASENLIPVTLELGGKSPVIIDETYPLELAVKRIVFGKLINAGQTCIAPDYVLLKQNLVKPFEILFKKYVTTFYQENPLLANHYPKIITKKHLDRLNSLIESHHEVIGGRANDNKLEPTLILNAKLSDRLMQEEIFGPILPIIPVLDIKEAIDIIKSLDKPLALYHFSKDKKQVQKVLNELSFGGATINDTLMHFVNHDLPFGGVGNSGMGSYHGNYSFKTFSHEKSVLYRGKIDLPFRYHPIKEKLVKMLRKITK